MREMLNTLLSFFRLDNGKEQPNFSSCRISAITYILETEFTPIAMNKELALTVTNYTDVKVYSFLFIYNPQNHPDEFLKRNGSDFFGGLKRSGSISSKNE